jgi:hypothetical protein
MPFAALCRRYPSLVQLPGDGIDGDKARFPKFTNCRSQGLGSRIRGPLVCQTIIGPAVAQRYQAQARQHPYYGGQMPPAAKGGRYAPSVQLVRQRSVRNEVSHHQLPNGRGACTDVRVCDSLFFKAMCTPRLRDKVLPRNCFIGSSCWTSGWTTTCSARQRRMTSLG